MAGVTACSAATGWVEGGVFEAVLETLTELPGRAHPCADGIKKGLGRPRRSVARAVALPASSIHAVTEGDVHSASC